MSGESVGTKLKDKIKHVLTEARVVLPGAQALLGFQLITFLMDGFEKLPNLLKYVHLISLCLTAVSIILLMTPRITESSSAARRPNTSTALQGRHCLLRWLRSHCYLFRLLRRGLGSH